MKPIATDTYNFEGLITRGYTYVDKTEVLYPLVNDSIDKQFFRARPRRFGKSLLGTHNTPEVKANDGRIYMVVDFPNGIYIIEFKLNKPAAEPMEQIKLKDYAGKYALSNKRMTLIGISFSSKKRTIVDELIEEM
jgi:hypothetical protein